MQNSLQLNGFNNYICSVEAFGLSLCFSAYSEHSAGEEIMYIGFNPNSGCVYIALDNGISICSNMGQSVEYLVNNFDNGEEYFFDTYHEAETFDPHEVAELG